MNEQVLISTIQTLSQEIGKEIAEKHITMAEVNLLREENQKLQAELDELRKQTDKNSAQSSM